MVLNGVYKIKDEFYDLFDDEALTHNKGENRPFFYCIEDENVQELYWLIPMTSQVDKLKATLREKYNDDPEKCDLFIINHHSKKPSAFLTVDIFPIIKKFIHSEYTMYGQHYVIKDKKLITQINKKARKVLALKNKGVKLTPKSIDILKIKDELVKLLNE